MTDQKHDDLALSDEERAALADDSPTDALPAEVVEEPAAPAAAPAAAAPAAPAGDGAAAAAGGTESEPEAPAEREAFVPRFEAEPIEGAEEKLTELETKLENGDLTLAEYNRERDAIQAAKLQADFAAKQNDAIAKQRWAWEVDSFLDQNRALRDNPLLNAALDKAVRTLADDKANEHRPMRWFLETAGAQVNELLGASKPAPVPTGGKPAPAPAPAARVPNTLAQAPAAAANVSDGEFSVLDGLNGEDLEAAVAKLTPAQREKWIRAA
jgi:hypothetical protein